MFNAQVENVGDRGDKVDKEYPCLTASFRQGTDEHGITNDEGGVPSCRVINVAVMFLTEASAVVPNAFGTTADKRAMSGKNAQFSILNVQSIKLLGQ